MENPEKLGAQHLHQIDSKLHASQPVEHEMERKKIALRHEKEKADVKDKNISQKPADKISDWLERVKVFAIGIMLLTHPEREVQWEQLHVDCAGDEFSSDADGDFFYFPGA